MAWELLKPVDPIVEETVAPGLWGPSIWSIPPREYWLRLGIAVVLTLYAIFKITHRIYKTIKGEIVDPEEEAQKENEKLKQELRKTARRVRLTDEALDKALGVDQNDSGKDDNKKNK